MKKFFKSVTAIATTGAAFVASQAHALDTTVADQAINDAGAAASSSGGLVIAAVAAIAGVGLIIALIRKI